MSDLPRAVRWFDRLFGEVESFEPNGTERVWTLAEHCYLYVELQAEHAGHSMVTFFVDDFDGLLEAAARPAQLGRSTRYLRHMLAVR